MTLVAVELGITEMEGHNMNKHAQGWGKQPCAGVTFAVILSRCLVPRGRLAVPGVVGVTVVDTGVPAVVVVTLLHLD